MSDELLVHFLSALAGHTLASFTSWDRFSSSLRKIPALLTDFDSGMAWPYLLTSFGIAYLLYRAQRQRTQSEPSFLQFVFPGRIYRHSSAVVDYWFYAANVLLKVLLIGPIVAGVGLLAYRGVAAVASGYTWGPSCQHSQVVVIVMALGWFLLVDFANYLAHLLFHRIPILWAFHVVHHSAQVLTPVTARRFHPVETFVTAIVQAPVAGAAYYWFQALPADSRRLTLIFGVSLFTFLFHLGGRHLRHSHIWLSYSPRMSRVLISPAQHQIHHSLEPQHRDKNLGEYFALWDAMFGTLYVPRQPETLQIGLPVGAEGRFNTVGRLYTEPFLLLRTRLSKRVQALLIGHSARVGR